MSFEVLARIPELPCPASAPEPKPAPAVVQPVVVQPVVVQPVVVQPVQGGMFSPSILSLVAIAAIVWVAAWRNDQLRWDAAQRQRPERLAQELPAAGTAARSHTP
ncbi:MAG: hypothetical protein WCQ77_07495 [Planctomycetota bacterium]